MSMFENVTEHVVRSAGPTTLHAVGDINSAERCQTLCVVERRKSFWFWKSPSMIPTFVTLNDMLAKGEDLETKEKQFTLMKKFSDNPTLNLSGNIEVAASLAKKIAAECNFNLEGSDKVELVINLGDITKCEINFEDLRRQMEDKPIDISHPLYVMAAKKSPKSSLCVVIEDLSTKSDGSVTEDKEAKISVSGGASVGPNSVQCKVKGSGSVESKNAASFTIPPSTVLAYACVEMSVDENGMVRLHEREDRLDESLAELKLPEDPFHKIKMELEPLVKLHNIKKIQDEIKLLLTKGTETDFRIIHILFYYANTGTKMSVQKLKHLLGNDVTNNWKNFMIQFGCTTQEDTFEGDIIVLDNLAEDVRKACLSLIDSILCLHEKSWREIPAISHEHSQTLMHVIKRAFENKGNSLHDSDLKSMLSHDPVTREFLENCQFKETAGNMLSFTGKNCVELLDVYVMLYFLSSWQKHCSIL